VLVHQTTEVIHERLEIPEGTHEVIKQRAYMRDKGAFMTDWHEEHIPEFKLIADQALSIANQQSDTYDMEITHLWGQLYNEGDFQESHDHVPHDYTFVFYVNTPEGSSPIVFDASMEELHPRPGSLLVFPGWVKHSVPKNKCEGRSIIAGNFSVPHNIYP